MAVLRSTTKYIVTFLFFFIVSCSSGGGGEGGTGVTAVSKGSITQFGSIFVNGVEFDTTNAAVNMDGMVGDNSDLRLNMIVTVYGTINPDGLTGVAQSVVVKEVIKGIVEEKNGPDSIVVLGQTVEIPSSSRFDNVVDLTGISVGDIVEVSGYVKANGVITANRVELMSTNDSEFKTFGVIQNLDTISKTFQFGGLKIDYSGAAFSGIIPVSLAENMYLEVKGAYNKSISTLFANKIEKDISLSGSADELEIEGFVTSITSPTEFSVDYIPVVIDSSTSIEGGTIDDILVGSLAEVEGMLVNGILMAAKIGFEDDVRIEAQVNSVDLNNQTLTFIGMPGLLVQSNSFTEYSESMPNDMGSIVAGTDVVKVRGYRLGNSSTVVARSVELQSATTQVSLQGPVSTINATSAFDILGVTIDTVSILDADFTSDDVVLGRVNFFTELAVDKVVEVEGVLGGSVITWQKADIVD